MKHSDINSIVSKCISQLFPFAYSLIPDELQAEQLILDAYAVFVLKENTFLKEALIDLDDDKELKETMEFFLMSIMGEIYQLAKKRISQLGDSLDYNARYKGFYHLDISVRAVLYLKDIMQMDDSDIQAILIMHKHQLLERLYIGRKKLSVELGKEIGL